MLEKDNLDLNKTWAISPRVRLRQHQCVGGAAAAAWRLRRGGCGLCGGHSAADGIAAVAPALFGGRQKRGALAPSIFSQKKN